MKTAPSRTTRSKAHQPEGSGSTCPNPFCSCDPCRCKSACRCGVSRLSVLEQKVMTNIWLSQQGEVTVRDVADEMSAYAYTTVATILDRLVDKGVLRRRLTKNTKYYMAIGSSSAHTAVLMHAALAGDPDQDSVLRRFVSGLDPAQMECLRSALSDEGG